MKPINPIVLLQWLMNESKDKVWVKNKTSGAVYDVFEFDPAIHIKASKSEIDRTKKQYSDMGDFRKSSFAKTEEGKEISQIASSFLDKGHITFENAKKLKKYIIRDTSTEPSKYAVKDDSGNMIARLPDGIFDSWIVRSSQNKSQAFVNEFKEISKKQKNAGFAAEDAATKYLSRYAKNPSKLDKPWQNAISNLGADISKAFEIKHTDLKTVQGVDPITGKPSKGTSKVDIILIQNGKEYKMSVKYTGGSGASFGQWHPRNIKSYLEKMPDSKKYKKEITEATDALDRIAKSKYPNTQKGMQDRQKDQNLAGEFMKTPIGKQFILDVMTTTTQSCKLPESSVATHIMIINEKGGVECYAAKEYLDILITAGAGTNGCGVGLSNSAGGEKRQTLLRSKVLQSEIDFRVEKIEDYYPNGVANARKK